ncbi:MAG: hypothetical protein QOH23_2233 [Gaiellaceae bacterium]|jgi:hypothetical protein|nr:hypothetical protein [Gaiellaceae bacterium]
MRGVAVLLVCLPVLAAGCAFEGQIAIGLSGTSPVLVKESTKVEFAPQSVEGTTTRAGQIVRIDCSVTGVYDVREATGSAVLIQTYVVYLRTRPLPRGTPYQLDCAGPLIVQLPAGASNVTANATDAAGLQTALPVQAPVVSVPLASGKKLRAESGTRFSLIGQPELAPGNYTVELGFNLPEARTFRQKVVYAASISCGRSKYIQPIRPLVAKMAKVPPFTIQPSAIENGFSTPHLFGGIRSYGEATRTLSCAR